MTIPYKNADEGKWLEKKANEMKTAEELFYECNHDLALSNSDNIVITLVEFVKALTEHNKEIISLINKRKAQLGPCDTDFDAGQLYALDKLQIELKELKWN